MDVPQRVHKVKALLATGRDLQIQFYGLPRRPRQPASVYTYRGQFTLEGARLRHPDMRMGARQYTRHVSKIKDMRIA